MATSNISIQDVLCKIEQSDDFEIGEIIDAVIQRYQTVFPDWEIAFLSLPKNPEERLKQLDATIENLRKFIPL